MYVRDIIMKQPFNTIEYLKVFLRYSSYFSEIRLVDELKSINPNVDITKCIISEGVFAKCRREDYLMGYGGGEKKLVDAKKKYQEHLIKNPEYLIKYTIEIKGIDKTLAMCSKAVGDNVRENVQEQAYKRKNDGYDRHLFMEYYYLDQMKLM